MATGTTSITPETDAGRRKAGGGRRTSTPAATANGQPTRRLVIVESSTKAKKIAQYLGKDYVVEASVGHIRDLPRGASDVPAKYKGESWARLGVDVDNQFAPLYIVTPEKKGKVAELRDALKTVDELLLATDHDREGEAIAWHLLETLKPKIPVRRMVFHEITEPAIRAAVQDLRDLDLDLVDAQETRRILDRLYGYEVSPVLWKKVMPKLSAGRVQSVATRIIVQRERERMAFVSASYWDIAAQLDAGADATPRQFGSRLVAVDGDRVATGRDFGADGRLKGSARALDEASARRLAEALQGRDLTVESVESKPYTRKPYAPFMTSTLQQEAGRKLRFSADRTMRSAQRLYENGHITYLRTDSTTLSESAIAAARAQARELYGDAYVPAQPRQYTRKVKNAQEAHEAIRPAGETFRTPGPDRPRGRRRRLPALRADLAAHGGLADGRRPRHHGERAHRRHRRHRRGGHVRLVRAHHHLPRLPQGLRGDRRRPGRRRGRRRRVAAARADQGPAADRGVADPGGALDQPAVPVHRAQPDQDAGGPRHRPAVHLRVDHQDHPGPRLRVEEGPGAGPVLDRVRRGRAARAPLRAAGRLRLHRRHGGRAGLHRRRQPGPHRLAGRVLLRRRPGQRGLDRPGRRAEEAGRHQPGGDRRPGDQLGPGVRRHRGPGRPLRAVPGAGPRRGVAAGQPARRPAARRADPGGGRAAVLGAAGGALAGRRPGDRARDRGQGGPLRPVRDRAAARRRAGRRRTATAPGRRPRPSRSRAPGRCSRA